MDSPSAASRLFARIEFTTDEALPQLGDLFDSEWVWQVCQAHLPPVYGEPSRMRIRHFLHSIGRSALACYELEWRKDRFLPAEFFTFSISRQRPLRIQRFPDDERLPALAEAATPGGAINMVNAHVLKVPVRRARVQVIRYRPGFRAVLRHHIGKLSLYARVLRPADFAPFLAAYHRSTRSGFAVPGLAGHWATGGILWLTALRGETLRALIRSGYKPPPERILADLERLWDTPLNGDAGSPLNLRRAYRRARRSFRHHLRDCAEETRALREIDNVLDSFSRAWRPVCMAHNDFYDDQLLHLRDGRVALVDFEDIAPGDPMLDIGNFVGHLQWSATFTTDPQSTFCREYGRQFREAALERFGWDARALALREAICLFRICTNTIRHPKADWRSRLDAGLSLVAETLG